MCDVTFRLVDMIARVDAIHRGTGQLIPAFRRAAITALEDAGPVLLEPWRRLTAVVAVLERRREAVERGGDDTTAPAAVPDSVLALKRAMRGVGADGPSVEVTPLASGLGVPTAVAAEVRAAGLQVLGSSAAGVRSVVMPSVYLVSADAPAMLCVGAGVTLERVSRVGGGSSGHLRVLHVESGEVSACNGHPGAAGAGAGSAAGPRSREWRVVPGSVDFASGSGAVERNHAAELVALAKERGTPGTTL